MCNLKAFYKFWESACEKRIGNCNAMEISKRTWIEAMKKVLDEIGKLCMNDELDNRLLILEEIIQKELGELGEEK